MSKVTPEEKEVMSEDDLINLISENIGYWVQEEVDNNDGDESKVSRFNQNVSTFMIELQSRLDIDCEVTVLEESIKITQRQINELKEI